MLLPPDVLDPALFEFESVLLEASVDEAALELEDEDSSALNFKME